MTRKDKGRVAVGFASVALLALMTWQFTRANHQELRADTLARTLAAERDCEKAPACLDDRARYQSQGAEAPVVSRTGRRYYKGAWCAGDCQAEAAGYQWAEQTGATKPAACSGHAPGYDRGCLAAMAPEAQVIERDMEPDPYDKGNDY